MSDTPRRFSDAEIKQFYVDGLTGARPHSGYEPEGMGQPEARGPRSAQELIRRQSAERDTTNRNL